MHVKLLARCLCVVIAATTHIARVLVVCSGLAMLAHGTPVGEEQAATWKATCLDLIPTPKQCQVTGREFRVPRDAAIAVVARPASAIQRTAVQTLSDFFHRKGFRNLKTSHDAPSTPADLTIIVGGPDLASQGIAELKPASLPRAQGYFLRTLEQTGKNRRVVAGIAGGDDAGTLYGVYTFLKTLRPTPQGVAVPEVRIVDEPAISVRGISPQWAWYIGDRGPYDAALWNLDRWKTALDFMAEYRYNVLALCTYGKFPFPLERYRSRCAVDLPFEVWNPQQGLHTIRWTHPAYEHDFLGALVEYAHARGIKVLIYGCLNLQDEIGSRQWTNEAEIHAYIEIQQHLLKRYGIDGFLFESLESLITNSADHARFGADEWSRLRADVFLTRRYAEAIRAVKPAATIGLIDHYLFFDWDRNRVPQRVGLTRWQAELPPETLLAYVHSPEAYDVFPPNRIWTYVFGPRGMPKPALQIDLADFCDVPRAKRTAGAYYVTYDWTPHEPNYLCFAESAWGNYGGADRDAFKVYWEGRGVGGPLSRRVWNAIQRELYGHQSGFGEGLRTATEGAFSGGQPADVLRRVLHEELVPLLDARNFNAAGKLIDRVERRGAVTAAGLAKMQADCAIAAPAMVTPYDLREHLDKAQLLTQVQLAWAEFSCRYYRTALTLARQAGHETECRKAIDDLRPAARAAYAVIRDSLARAYFSYPHDVLGKYEFLAADGVFLDDLERLPSRFDLETDSAGKGLRLRNVAASATASADSTYRAGFYDPVNAIDGKQGTPSRDIWVAAETASPHRLELRFPTALLRGIVVNWARDASRDWVARDFIVEIHAGAQWRRVAQQKDNRQTLTVIKLDPAVRTDQVRIEITRGSASRPRLAAVNEVELLAIPE